MVSPRTLGPFPVIAGGTREVFVGALPIVQVAAGGQPGLWIYWVEPSSRAYDGEHGLELDRDGLAAPIGDAERVWLRWDSTVRQGAAFNVELIGWPAGEPVPPAWDRAGRQESFFLKRNSAVVVGAGSTVDLIAETDTTSLLAYRGLGESWLRRFGSLLGYCEINLGAAAAGSVQLNLGLTHGSGGAAFIGAGTRASRTTWEAHLTVTKVMRPLVWPLPPQPFRVECQNTAGVAVTVNALWYLMTSIASNGGSRP